MKIYITIEVDKKVVFEDVNTEPVQAIRSLKRGITRALDLGLEAKEKGCLICGAEDCDH